MLYVIVCVEQEKLGKNIYENVSLTTSPAATTVNIVEKLTEAMANVLKLDTETITEVHLTQADLLNISQAQHTGNPADLHIAAGSVAPHTENPTATTANVLKLEPETITEVHLTQADLLNIGQAQHMGNPADLHIAAGPVGPHAENPAATTANGHKLDPETGIVGVTAVLHDTLDTVISTANLRTLDPVVSIVADQAVLHDTQDPVVRKANHRTLDLAVSIVAEAVLRNMRDRIAKGVASTAQNVDSLRK